MICHRINNLSPVSRLDKVHATFSPGSSDVFSQTLMGDPFSEDSRLEDSLLEEPFLAILALF